MESLRLRTTIAADGTIDLHILSDLPPGEAEVIVVVQPSPPAPVERPVSLSGRFAGHQPPEDEVMNHIRQLRRETTEASWELAE